MARRWDTIEELSAESVFDSRDVEELIEELEDADDPEGHDPLSPEDRELLDGLRDIREEAWTSEWRHGVGFIRESHFEDYAREMAEDCGYLSDMKNNPLANCIDWGEWADLVMQDYSSIDIDGTTFYYRD